ncbi:unnamed protein product [Parnassius mnemosyne]|uniref:Reverse transcriptase domain-containing protein n=1 Tax=Parnassius mnemosyne TaxID=213953 RepID=A0AAV1LZY0_9NEOP
MHQNIRSITRNMDELKVLIHRTALEWDLILLTECWLPSTHYIPIMDGYNYCKTLNNATQNEGVVVYFKKSLNITWQELSISDCNSIFLKICKDTIVIVIYRPPGFKDPTNFIESLSNMLDQYSHYKNIIIIGDINIDIVIHSKDSYASYYLNSLASKGMLPAHTFPTHGKTCLDHVVLKTKLQSTCYVAETSITDHDTLIFLFEANFSTRSLPPKIRERINYDKLDSYLSTLDFKSIYSMVDVDLAATFLMESLSNALKINTKTTKVSNRKIIKKPWITPGILRCLRNRDKLHQKCKKYPDDDVIITTYKRYRNYCNELLKKLKKEYEKSELTAAVKISNKKLWDTIKIVTNMNKQNNKADKLLNKSDPITSVNYVNSFFINMGKSLAEKHHINNNTSSIFPINTYQHSIVLLDTDEHEIETIILNMKTNCSVGRDNISTFFLKRYRNLLVPPITYICNLSLKTGKFPNCFKLAEIHPIYKSGDAGCVNNYRPISILPTVSKILEKVINKRLTNYLEKHNLLSHCQYGFRPKRSTQDAVHELTDFIVTNLDSKKKVVAIFLDLAKAFDTVSVPLLLNRLEDLGIRNTQLKLFSNYLTGRYQRVRIGGCCSDDLPVSYGVPQGSVLGPTLFLTYINSLCNVKIHNGRIIAFADDMALLFQADTWSEVFNFAQNGFDLVNKWLKEYKLTLNVDKTKYIAFTTKNINVPELEYFHITAHCCSQIDSSCSCPTLSRTDCIKYLGVMIDNTLSFHFHIGLLSTRIRKLIYIFKNLRRVADHNVIKMVYFALCQSLLIYCITIWGGAPKTTMLQLERAQRAVLKVSYSLPFLFPTTDLYQQCSVLSVRKLFILHTALLQHSMIQYESSNNDKRRKYVVCPSKCLKTQFSHRFFCFLGGYLYKKLNKRLLIYSLTKHACKQTLQKWLLNIDYKAAENLLTVLS